MNLSLTTPALLFPAISLLLLAYTNRFLAIASLIRGLHSKYNHKPEAVLEQQISILRKRVVLIKHMQFAGILSLLLCVASMGLLYALFEWWGQVVFGVSLVVMMWSLVLSLIEIQISVTALNLELSDMA